MPPESRTELAPDIPAGPMGPVGPAGPQRYRPRKRKTGPVEAILWQPLEAHKVRCNLCSFRCVIHPGHIGVCNVRQNEGGVLYALNYRKATAVHVDPMEKKPLFHFHPGTPVLSLGAPGCNYRCQFCQNWDISQMPGEHHRIEGRPLGPEAIVDRAVKLGCRSLAYTYTEPTVYLEYAMEIGTLANERGLHNVLVTNGYATQEAFELMAPWVDAMNIDLKGFDDRFYLKVCRARHAPVCETIQRAVDRDIWVEISTPLIPGHNDSDESVHGMAAFLAKVNPDMPWHLLSFHPDYRMLDVPPTPPETLKRAAEIGRAAGLRYVYAHGSDDASADDTLCPGCGAAAIRREGFAVTERRLDSNRCSACGYEMAGVDLSGADDLLDAQDPYRFCG